MASAIKQEEYDTTRYQNELIMCPLCKGKGKVPRKKVLDIAFDNIFEF